MKNPTAILLFAFSSLLSAQTVESIQDTVFLVSAQELPEPIGGIMAIQQNIVYPQSARLDSVEGTVYVEAFISAQGKVVRTRVAKGVQKDLNEAAQTAISKTHFQPGKTNNKPVNVQISIPIRFKLSGSSTRVRGNNVQKPGVFILKGPKELKEDIRYPGLAIRAGIQGIVFASVNVDENRRIKQLTINKGIGAGCDEQVLRALVSSNFGRFVSKDKTKGAEQIDVIVEFVLPEVAESSAKQK